MAEKEYIDRGAAISTACKGCNKEFPNEPCEPAECYIQQGLFAIPAADVAEVVRCQDCIYAVPFDRNCELNTSAYLHCGLLRGEEVKNVWHKYKKYYKDYSVVDCDGFCDSGVKMDGKGDTQ